MKKVLIVLTLIMFTAFAMTSCEEPAPHPVKWAGVRVSGYGMRSSFGGKNFPSVSTMVGFGNKMSACFEGSTGAYIILVGTISSTKDKSRTHVIGGKCSLEFTLSSEIDNAYCGLSEKQIENGVTDFYEDYLTAMDNAGHSVWLQVEPGDADLVELAKEVMNHYKHHPCVKGFGIDVEWYEYRATLEEPDGDPIDEDSSKLSDATAKAVVDAVRAINPEYTVFVKHWDERWLPPTYREGLIFVSDSQYYDSPAQQRADFANWAAYYAPNPVMFQIGYSDDKDSVWGRYSNPAKELGQYIADGCNSGNDIGIIWVDFTLKEAMNKINN